MKPLLFLVIVTAGIAACGDDFLLQPLSRSLVSGTVLLDSVAEPATVRMIRESTGEVGDSEVTDSVGFYEIADGWDGECNWRVEVEFNNIVADSMFLANLSGPLVVEGIVCASQVVDFDLSIN